MGSCSWFAMVLEPFNLIIRRNFLFLCIFICKIFLLLLYHNFVTAKKINEEENQCDELEKKMRLQRENMTSMFSNRDKQDSCSFHMELQDLASIDSSILDC